MSDYEVKNLMTPDQVLEEYAAKYSLTGCRLDADGFCRLTLDNACHVDLEHRAGSSTLVLQAAAGHVSPDDARSLAALLAANLLTADRESLVTAYDAAEERALLILPLNTESLDAEGFERALAGFVAALEELREYISGHAETFDPGLDGSYAPYAGEIA